jgi:hypothetical protein
MQSGISLPCSQEQAIHVVNGSSPQSHILIHYGTFNIISFTSESPKLPLSLRLFDRNFVYISSLSRKCYIPARLIYLDFITLKIFDKGNKLWNFLHSLLTFTLLGPNISLSTLPSNTLNLRSFLNLGCHATFHSLYLSHFFSVLSVTTESLVAEIGWPIRQNSRLLRYWRSVFFVVSSVSFF